MDESLSADTPEPELAPVVTTTSIWARMCNVFAAPEEVFAEVKASPPATANWLVPAIVFSVVGVICTVLLFSQDWALQQMRELQEKAIDTQLAKQGIKPEQIAAQKEMMMKFAEIGAKVGAILGPLVGAVATPFWWALFLWLLGKKALKGSFTYMRAVEVAGLSMMIAVLEMVLRTLLALLTGNLMATPTPALLLKEFDLNNRGHVVLAAINPLSWWMLAIMALGMARLAGASFGRAAAWLFGVWLVFKAAVVGLGLAKFGL